MKKIGIIVFILALSAGLVISSIFSFGDKISKVSSPSFFSKMKGSGNVESEKREVRDFSAIDVSGIFQVEIVAQKDFEVIVEADDNLLPLISTEVRGDTLKIKKKKRFSTQNPIRIKVFAPNIKKLDVSGVAKVSLINVENDSLKIDASGASNVKIEGITKNVAIDINGATKVIAEKLKTKKASVDANGASKAYIYVSNELEADLSGASKVIYSGNPQNVNKSISGASSIQER